MFIFSSNCPKIVKGSRFHLSIVQVVFSSSVQEEKWVWLSISYTQVNGDIMKWKGLLTLLNSTCDILGELINIKLILKNINRTDKQIHRGTYRQRRHGIVSFDQNFF